MKVLIITGGQIDGEFASDYIRNRHWDRLICADSGLEFCRKTQILPDLILGDFDSAKEETVAYYRSNYPDRMEVFPAMKDETDTELALLRAIDMGADSITILGATGTRLDHVLGNIQLLKLAMDAGVTCYMVDRNNRIRMTDHRIILDKKEQFGTYVSLLPFTPQVEGLTLEGFVYEVQNDTLTSGVARGVSNVIAAPKAVIDFTSGILLVIESRD